YIGASYYTYWSEDFWWAVGFKTVTLNPSYNSVHLGAYDRMFHTHNEPQSEWCNMQGQLMIGGNLAVQESTSSRKLYYWEIYHLMGDPSLKIKIIDVCPDFVNFINQTVTTDTDIVSCGDINVQNVTVTNNAKLTLDAAGEVNIINDFEVELGSEFEIK
ncbi:MAG: hypothetical protein LBT25_03355, partial [Candidatus Symbiothrix sp.]|nr:hypothetical protein [Candidatus Symbiothrix sp.]